MSEHAETDIRLRFLTFPMKDKSAQRYYVPYDTDDIINASDAEGSTASEVLTALNTAINDLKGNIAEPFDPTKAYSAGEYVLYEGDLYKFTEDHDAGAWTGSDATEVNILEELDSLNTAVNDLKGNIAEPFDPTKVYSAGEYVLYEGDLYKFTEDHDAGAWTGSDAEQTSIADSLASLADASYSTDDITNLSNVKGSNATEALNNLLGNIASVFDPSKDYNEGQLVLYEGILHQFSENHPAGPWNVNDVERTTIGEEIEPFVAKYYISITLNTSDGAPVPWQSNVVKITVIDSYQRAIYEELYNGQPVTIQVNYGEQYTITANEINGYWNRPKAEISITQLLETVVLTYESFDYVNSFPKAKEVLDTGADFSAAVGNQLTTTKDDKSLAWDIVDYDSDNAEITLMLHSTVCNGSPYNDLLFSSLFDAEHAVFYATDEVPAGDYFIKIQTSNAVNTYYLTLEQSIPSGGIMFIDSEDNVYPSSFVVLLSHDDNTVHETGTISSDVIPEAVEFAALPSVFSCCYLDSDKKVSISRSFFGGNNIGDSFLFNWLNSYADVGDIISQTLISMPVIVEVPGFLNNFTQEDLNCIEDTDWKCNASNSKWEVPANLGGSSNGSLTYTIRGKFCVPSRKEIFGSAPFDDGSTQFALFSGASANDRIKYYLDPGQTERAIDWVLRTPNHYNSAGIALVNRDGELVFYNSGSGTTFFGIAPICKIKGHVPD